jgi:hypothetical protein
MKKNILLATAIIVATLMIAVSASTAIQIQPQEKQTLILNKNLNVEIAGMDIAPLKGTVGLTTNSEQTVQPLAVPVALGAHPAVASDSLGYVVLGYEEETPNVYFTASGDGGETFEYNAVGWAIDPPPTLPDADSCGDGRFICGMVPDYLASSGSELYKVEVSDPMLIPDGYSCPYWTWEGVGSGYTNFDAIAVGGYTAADPAENLWAFGGHTIIGDNPDSGVNVPFFSYQFDDTGYAWIYRWTGIAGCTATAMDIDQDTLYSYGVWNYDESGELDIFIDIMDFGQWVPYGSYVQHPEVTNLAIDSTGNDNYIDVSAKNDNIIVVSERDGDIIAYYSLNGMTNVNEVTIETGADNPRIVHIGDQTAICTFVQGGSVYYTITTNGGANWDTPALINEPENVFVPQEFKASDVCGFGAAWMNTDDTTIYFGEIVIGNPPGIPSINAPANGNKGQDITFIFSADDPDLDNVRFIVDWGDGNIETSDYVASGDDKSLIHQWGADDTYTVTVRAQDSFGNIGDPATHDIVIPRSKSVQMPLFLRFLQKH